MSLAEVSSVMSCLMSPEKTTWTEDESSSWILMVTLQGHSGFLHSNSPVIKQPCSLFLEFFFLALFLFVDQIQ